MSVQQSYVADQIVAHAKQTAVMCESLSVSWATVDSTVRGQDVAKHVNLILAISIAVLHRPDTDIMYMTYIHGRPERVGLLGRLKFERLQPPCTYYNQGHFIAPDVPAI